MIAIGAAYATLGRASQGAPVGGGERLARAICVWALIAIFLTGYVGYFVVDIFFWPGFYYLPIKAGKNVWLALQLACMGRLYGGRDHRLRRHETLEPDDCVKRRDR